MPDNSTAGILEDFLRFLIPSEAAPLQRHAENSVEKIPTPRKFPKVRETKAILHTYLAWQEEPGKPLGLAISARYLDQDVPEVDQFTDWLRKLFFS